MPATTRETALTGLNHVVIAVASVSDAARQWERVLGVEARNFSEGSALRMRRCQIDVGDAYFALCEPMDEQSVFHRFLQKRGEGVYAISFNADNYDAIVKRIQDEGGSVTVTGSSAWVHPKHTHGVNLGLHPNDGLPHGTPTGPSIFKGFRFFVIAVQDRDEAAADWQRYIGLEPKEPRDVPEQGVRRLQFDVAGGDMWVALVEPLGEESLQRAFLAEHGEGTYAIGVRVDDLPATARDMQSRGATIHGDVDADETVYVDPRNTNGLLLGLTT
jgi:4-hydroxyphenylpyruvate dioxygenase-like putative hemolysin